MIGSYGKNIISHWSKNFNSSLQGVLVNTFLIGLIRSYLELFCILIGPNALPCVVTHSNDSIFGKDLFTILQITLFNLYSIYEFTSMFKMASYGSIWSPLVNNNLKYLEDLSEYEAKIVAYANTKSIEEIFICITYLVSCRNLNSD